jgi:hypothetical protein
MIYAGSDWVGSAGPEDSPDGAPTVSARADPAIQSENTKMVLLIPLDLIIVSFLLSKRVPLLSRINAGQELLE